MASPTKGSRWERHRTDEAAAAAGWNLSTVVAPARLFSANGLRFGPDGRCWIAEVWGGAVSAWDADTGDIVPIAPRGRDLSGPDDLAIGPDGSIYVTEYLEGKVAALRPDGRYEVLMVDSPKANGVTIDRDGRLFVDEFRAGGRLYELDPQQPNTPHLITMLDFPNALERGADGRLYVQNAAEGLILSVDPENGETRTEFRDLQVPSAMKFDAAGRLVVTEFGVGTVTAFDLITRSRHVIATLRPGLDNLCFDPEDRIYISNAMTCEVVRLDGGSPDSSTGSGFVGPCGLAPDHDGALLVADDLRIARVRSDGMVDSVYDPSFPGWSHRLIDLARVDDLIFGITTGGELVRLDPRTHEALIVLSADDDRATALAATDDGLVVGMQTGVIVALDHVGGVRGSRASGLKTVDAIASSSDVVVTCDRSAGAIAVIGPSESHSFSGWAAPEAIAVSGDEIYVLESATSCIKRTSLSAGSRAIVATGLPVGYPIGQAGRHRTSSLAVMSDGSIAIGCDGDGSLRLLTPI